jgi:hypothetical protein
VPSGAAKRNRTAPGDRTTSAEHPEIAKKKSPPNSDPNAEHPEKTRKKNLKNKKKGQAARRGRAAYR